MRDEALLEESCNRLIFSMFNNSQRKTLEQTWELDSAYGLKGGLFEFVTPALVAHARQEEAPLLTKHLP